MEMVIKTSHNRRLAQWRVKWLIEHSTSHQLLWFINSFVLRNPPLRQAPKRWQQAEKKQRQLFRTVMDSKQIRLKNKSH